MASILPYTSKMFCSALATITSTGLLNSCHRTGSLSYKFTIKSPAVYFAGGIRSNNDDLDKVLATVASILML
jgi:hypothetical protein